MTEARSARDSTHPVVTAIFRFHPDGTYDRPVSVDLERTDDVQLIDCSAGVVLVVGSVTSEALARALAQLAP